MNKILLRVDEAIFIATGASVREVLDMGSDKAIPFARECAAALNRKLLIDATHDDVEADRIARNGGM